MSAYIDNKNYTRMESRRQRYLQEMVDFGDRHFAPESGMLRLPAKWPDGVPLPNARGMAKDSSYESLQYALVLLELAERSLMGRAEAIISRVIELQETGNGIGPRRGWRPISAHSPGEDEQTAESAKLERTGMTLLLIWYRHRRRLKPELVARIVKAAKRAALFNGRGPTKGRPADVNIPRVFIMLSVAEIEGDAEDLTLALGRLEEAVASLPGPCRSTFDAPSEIAMNLGALHAINAYIRHPTTDLLTPPLAVYWGAAITLFHIETAKRAASPGVAPRSTIPTLLDALIEKASQGAVTLPHSSGGREDFDILYACVIPLEAPAEIVAGFASCEASRQIRA